MRRHEQAEPIPATGAGPTQALRRAALAVLLATGPVGAQEGESRPEPRPEDLSAQRGETVLDGEELEWGRAAWAYFQSFPPAPSDSLQPDLFRDPSAESAPPPADRATFLVPLRAGAPVATAWSLGDHAAALVLARRLGLIDAREFDRRFSGLVDFLNWMPLAMDGMPNRFYDATSGASLGGDLQPGIAGWSAVDTGRLLLWLRVAAEAHPDFAPFVRNAVARLSVCAVASPEGRLMAATASAEGTTYAPETSRGYDAVATQGYRAWGLDLPLPPAPETSPFEVEAGEVRFPVAEDLGNQPPVMTTPPAYLGFELGFEPIGDGAEEVAGGRPAEALMAALAEAQAGRAAETGLPVARADSLRNGEPVAVYGTVLAGGVPWAVVLPDGTARPDLALISVRATFALRAFPNGTDTEPLLRLVRELHDPVRGWYEGRSETTGAWETTRTSVTNAFVLEALAYQAFGPLFPEEARPEELVSATPDASGACRLPLARAPLSGG